MSRASLQARVFGSESNFHETIGSIIINQIKPTFNNSTSPQQWHNSSSHSLSLFSLTSPATGTFWKSANISLFNLGTEKLSHFQFYWHDIQSGSNLISISIVKPPPTISSSTGFGTVNMIDDLLTENNSRILGRAQARVLRAVFSRGIGVIDGDEFCVYDGEV
ncbi:hypothetical protein R6Q59_013368 [Mikania micrantha]